MNQIGNMVATSPNDGHMSRVTLPARKRLNHRGPLLINVSSAWYFITICAEGPATWVGSRIPRDHAGMVAAPRPQDGVYFSRDRKVLKNAIIFAPQKV